MIRSVHLRDFKSHEDTLVGFHPGANALLGHNGAGKTSILQAIGLCLFDAGTPGAWVRKGCKSGRATVTFETTDGTYSVERKVGGSGMKLLDADGNVLAETKADVYTGVKDLLHLPPETDLPRLFEELVGVPQGLLTAAFQQTPEPRRRVFDAILHVHAYRAAFDDLKHAVVHGEQTLQERREDIARLEGRLSDAPAHKEAMHDAGRRAEQADKDLAAAKRALEALAEGLAALEAKKRKADALLQQAHAADKALHESQAALQRLEADHEAAQQSQAWCKQHAQDLEDLKAKQAWLDTHADEVDDARQRLRELAGLEATLPGRRSALETARQRLQERQARLGDAPEPADLDAVEQDLQKALQGRRQAEQTLQDMQRAMSEARKTATERKELQAALAAPAPGRTHRTAYQKAREDRVALEARLQGIDVQFQQLSDTRTCPLLDATCPIADGDLEDRREALRSNLDGRLQILQKTLADLEAEARQEEEAAKRHAQAQAGAARLRELDAIAAQGEEAHAQEPDAKAALQASKDEVDRLTHRRDEALQQASRMQAWQQARESLKENQARFQQDEQTLRQDEARLEDCKQRAPSWKSLVDDARIAQQAVKEGRKMLEDAVVHGRRAASLPDLEDTLKEVRQNHKEAAAHHATVQAEAERAWTDVDAKAWDQARKDHEAATRKSAAAEAAADTAKRDLEQARVAVEKDKADQHRLKELRGQKQATEKALGRLREARGLIKDLGPQVAKRYVEKISIQADEHFRDLHGGRPVRLHWAEDYDVHVTDMDGHDRSFRDLSGGEQVMAALSVRLALLKALSPVPFAIYDEPTINLDDDVRRNVARVLQDSGLGQLIVVSHDDAFSESIHNAIRLHKPAHKSLVLEDVA